LAAGSGIDILTALESQSTNIPATKFTNTVLSTSTSISSARTTAWNSTLIHEFDITFSSTDDARYFFNKGGGFIFNSSRTGGTSSVQNSSWTQFLTQNSGFFFSSINYYALTTTYTPVFVASPPNFSTPYIGTQLQWTINAKRNDVAGINGGNGSIISFRISYIDNNTKSPDYIDGTITSLITEKKAVVTFPTVSPSYRLITPLSDANVAPNVPPPPPPENVFTATFNITSNTQNYVLHPHMISSGWNGYDKFDVILNVYGGVYVGATDIGVYAINAALSSAKRTKSKITINNYGSIMLGTAG
jgi:hypothetical protein